MIANFISADWAKKPSKRAIWIADRQSGIIYRPDIPPASRSLKGLLNLANSLSENGPVVVGVDVALGVSAGFWQMIQEDDDWCSPKTFVDWLTVIDPSGEFFSTAVTPEEWSISRPWFRVMEGDGGLNCFLNKVPQGMLRKMDRLTSAKPIFAVSGIPGTVGSGTREFWKEVVPLMSNEREFLIWPFEGELERLLKSERIVLCETYPALAYAAAIADYIPTGKIKISKSKYESRYSTVSLLKQAEWVRTNQIDLQNLESARNNEDDFDACLTAAAFLRCLCEKRQLVEPNHIDSQVEGSMLLLGPIDPCRIKKSSTEICKTYSSSEKATFLSGPVINLPHIGISGGDHVGDRLIYPCPISGCTKEFIGSRGGWDGHVGSLRIHPDWRPDVKEPENRRAAFRQEFSNWFE